MARLSTYAGRVKSTAWYYAGGVYRQTYEKDIFLWAQAISFKVLITLVPILILAIGVLGWFLQANDQAFSQVADLLNQYLPADQSAQFIIFLDRLQGARTFYAGLGVLALAFSAMTLMTTLRVVISNIFQEPWHRQRTIVGGYLFDIRMAVQVGLVFLLTLSLTVVFQNGPERLGLEYAWLTRGWRHFFTWIGLLVPYLLSIAMFFQLFFFVPKPHPPKRSALLGAMVTGLLWEVAKYAFALYATNLGRFDRYSVTGAEGQQGFTALGDAFGLIIAFVFWAYYSGLVLCIGGLIAVLHEKRHRMKRLQAQQAQREADAAEAHPERPAVAEPEAEIDAVGEIPIPAPVAETDDDTF